MTFMEIIRMLSGPFIGAVIGYFTNMIAVKMLFYPKREIRLFGRRLPLTPGVIPKGRPRLASSIGEVVEKYLLTKEDIKTHLLNEQTERKIADAAVEKLSGQIKEELCSLSDMDESRYEQKKADVSRVISIQIVKAIQSSDFTDTVLRAVGEGFREKASLPLFRWLVNDRTLYAVLQPAKEMLDTMIDEHGTEYISPMIENKLSEIDSGSGMDLLSLLEIEEESVRQAVIGVYRKMVDQFAEGILEKVHVSALVEEKINAMSIDELERLVQDVMKKELNAIINLGALIGFILGLLNLII